MSLVKHANPIALGRSAVGLGGAVVKGAAQAVGMTKGAIHLVSGARTAPEVADEGVPESAQHSSDDGPRSAGPEVVLAEPHAPDEPPVDVVGMALAAEVAAERDGVPGGSAVAHEPRAASREEDHGAAFERATVEEIVDESAAALEGDPEPELHLTEPLFDAADARSVRAEMAMMSKGAESDKG